MANVKSILVMVQSSVLKSQEPWIILLTQDLAFQFHAKQILPPYNNGKIFKGEMLGINN